MIKRNYGSEYKRYQKQQKQKKDRASRNAARRLMIKKGKVKRGDGKDVSHKNGNPRDNRPKNLTVKERVRIEVIAELGLQVNFIELHRRRNNYANARKKEIKNDAKRWCC